jgi:hypothetical protein
MGICGEGEEPFRLLLERIERTQPLGGIPGLYVRGKELQGARSFVKDLDRLPLPHGRLLTLAGAREMDCPVDRECKQKLPRFSGIM